MDVLTTWLEALHARHVAPYRPQEFTRALRALSMRYVERRNELAERSALDSAGKRAAFAAFYAPLHYLTVREIVRALPEGARQATAITDLGCGTGVGAAAWEGARSAATGAGAVAPRPAQLFGVDMSQWALEETKWNWRTLGLGGKAKRGDLVAEASAIEPARPGSANGRALILAWSVNELPRDAQARLLPVLLKYAQNGGQILIVEPLARAATPWWNHWSTEFAPLNARVDEWKFRVDLPPMLKELSSRAGFNREHLGARSLWIKT